MRFDIFSLFISCIPVRAAKNGPGHGVRMKSASVRLMAHVMAVYLCLTLAIFGMEVSINYKDTRDQISKELETLHLTFDESVVYALWQLDNKQIDVTLAGMLKMPSVTRVVLTAPDGSVMRDLTSPIREKAPARLLPVAAFVNKRALQQTNGGTSVPLGHIAIHSDSHVIVDRLKMGLLVTIAAALVKTALLLYLIKLYFDRMLTRPLFQIANMASSIDPTHASEAPRLPVKAGPPDELDVISMAINGLLVEVAQAIGSLDELKRGLEQQVLARTAALQQANVELDREREQLSTEVSRRQAQEKRLQRVNADLAKSLEHLSVAQKTLIESEKMIALGGLVAGVAHEINTPIGLGLTGASHFQYMVDQLRAKFSAGELEEVEFVRFLDDSSELSRTIFSSLERAAALVRSFKLVAVDQNSAEMRHFKPLEYINDVVRTLHSTLRKANVQAQVDADPALSIYSDAGAWAQVLVNLINNSVIHAFGPEFKDAKVEIELRQQADGSQLLTYRDNGRGMTAEVARKVFDPFFTTNRQQGGSGLGMHIVYNLVTQRLRGSIELVTAPGAGTCFRMQLPLLSPTPSAPSAELAETAH